MKVLDAATGETDGETGKTMNAIWHEVRQALGQLRHSPGFSAAAVVIPGLDLGVRTVPE